MAFFKNSREKKEKCSILKAVSAGIVFVGACTLSAYLGSTMNAVQNALVVSEANLAAVVLPPILNQNTNSTQLFKDPLRIMIEAGTMTINKFRKGEDQTAFLQTGTLTKQNTGLYYTYLLTAMVVDVLSIAFRVAWLYLRKDKNRAKQNAIVLVNGFIIPLLGFAIACATLVLVQGSREGPQKEDTTWLQTVMSYWTTTVETVVDTTVKIVGSTIEAALSRTLAPEFRTSFYQAGVGLLFGSTCLLVSLLSSVKTILDILTFVSFFPVLIPIKMYQKLSTWVKSAKQLAAEDISIIQNTNAPWLPGKTFWLQVMMNNLIQTVGDLCAGIFAAEMLRVSIQQQPNESYAGNDFLIVLVPFMIARFGALLLTEVSGFLASNMSNQNQQRQVLKSNKSQLDKIEDEMNDLMQRIFLDQKKKQMGDKRTEYFAGYAISFISKSSDRNENPTIEYFAQLPVLKAQVSTKIKFSFHKQEDLDVGKASFGRFLLCFDIEELYKQSQPDVRFYRLSFQHVGKEGLVVCSKIEAALLFMNSDFPKDVKREAEYICTTFNTGKNNGKQITNGTVSDDDDDDEQPILDGRALLSPSNTLQQAEKSERRLALSSASQIVEMENDEVEEFVIPQQQQQQQQQASFLNSQLLFTEDFTKLQEEKEQVGMQLKQQQEKNKQLEAYIQQMLQMNETQQNNDENLWTAFNVGKKSLYENLSLSEVDQTLSAGVVMFQHTIKTSTFDLWLEFSGPFIKEYTGAVSIQYHQSFRDSTTNEELNKVKDALSSFYAIPLGSVLDEKAFQKHFGIFLLTFKQYNNEILAENCKELANVFGVFGIAQSASLAENICLHIGEYTAQLNKQHAPKRMLLVNKIIQQIQAAQKTLETIHSASTTTSNTNSLVPRTATTTLVQRRKK